MGSLHDGARVSHSVSFLLGALLPTVLLFFLASDRLGEKLASISIPSLGNQNGPAHQQMSHANLISTHGSAQEKEVRAFPGLAELLPKVATDDRTAEATAMNLSSASDFMSDAYLELVWAKLELQQCVLQLGHNFLFTDVDVVWLRDPFRHIGVHADMAVSCDIYSGDADALDGNWPNTGFYYVKATGRTVEMMRRWRAARWRFPRDHEQAVFNQIKHELASADGGLRLRFQFLDTARFGGFCRLFRNDMARACTMHATCCFGLGKKLSDLRDVLRQWNNYSAMTPPERRNAKSAGWRVPAKCGTPDKRAPPGPGS
uniref:Nucleotide-diphospho-sugar transferase domain-containing protein n=1 Tax=Aegilops tauschii TaxID=37682 RepID=M8C2X1_AEGTA